MRVAKDIQVDRLKSNQRDIMPVIDITQYVPILGSIALNEPEDIPYYADGIQWLPFGGGSGAITTLTSAGGVETLVNDGTGPTLATKGLTAGTGITLTSTATNITIENTAPVQSVTTLTSAGGVETLVNDGTGPTLATKGLTAGAGIALTSAATNITIENTAPVTTLTSAGGVETLVNDGTGPTLATKGLTAGTNVTLTSDANSITINSTASGTTFAYSLQRVYGPDALPFQDVPSGTRVVMSPPVSPAQVGFTNPLAGQTQCPTNGYLFVDVNYKGVDLGAPVTTTRIGLFKIGDVLPIVSSLGTAVYGNSFIPVYELSTSIPVLAGDIFEIRAYSDDSSDIRISCPTVSLNVQFPSWATFTLMG